MGNWAAFDPDEVGYPKTFVSMEKWLKEEVEIVVIYLLGVGYSIYLYTENNPGEYDDRYVIRYDGQRWTIDCIQLNNDLQHLFGFIV